MLGLTLALGETEGETETEGLTLPLGETEGEADAEGDADLLGLTEADGDVLALELLDGEERSVTSRLSRW